LWSGHWVGETIWASQKNLAAIFSIDRSVITKHLQNIFSEKELDEDSVCAKIAHTASDGKKYQTTFYNLDVIIAVGYRVNSYEATQFRIWATKILKEYLIKGFALDDERLKQGNNLFNKDYFTELLERIREIRSSERMFYQKITDLYAESIDYDPKAPITQEFYATVQNKLHWAIHHHTAGELIKLRAKADAPNMGLTSWKNAGKGGKIIKTDITVAKNYLTKEEIEALNRFSVMFLDYAENLVKRGMVLKMKDWASRLDSFLQFNEYDILKDAGKVSHAVACALAEKEYSKFRIIQDKEYKSDFDKVIEGVKNNELPKEEVIKKAKNPFDQTLKAVLTVPPPKESKKRKTPFDDMDKKDKEN
jgi:hypothetical protein